MKKIEKYEKEVNVLSLFVGDHDGIIDATAAAALETVKERVGEAAASVSKARDDVAVARTSRDDSFENLQRSILGCKKVVEMVVIRDGKGVLVPTVSSLIKNPARIHILAGKYLKAAEQAGRDPAVVKAAASLKSALDRYVSIYNDAYDKVSATHTAREKMAVDLVGLGGEVNAYKILIASRSPAELRRELDSRLKAALPRKSNKKAPAPEAPVTMQTAVTTLPAMPAIPTMQTVVPPSSEHPIVSANA